MKVNFNIQGLNHPVGYTVNEVEKIYKPLLRKLTKYSRKKEEPLIVFLAAPPGTGKSTLSLFLEYLSGSKEEFTKIQALPLDGFHHFNSFLKSNYFTEAGKRKLLYERKGAPETFNFEAIKKQISKLKLDDKLKWPIYDRNLHEPVMDVIEIKEKIILIEGNWLLLDEENWRDLKNYCDFSIFIETEEAYLRERLIRRKSRGGLSREEAKVFYENSDLLNVKRVLNNHLDADLVLTMLASGENIIKNREELCQ